ncbi:MAG TPA: hypothetical protein DCF33_03905 [Saprospirales bacterium]|nr:hypothetical protein [Saprospirales bacterium]
MRIFRAVIAVWAIAEAWRTGEWLLLFPGGIFALQAIFDVGCCGASGCAPAQRNFVQPGEKDTEVVYEEIR